MSPLNMVHLYGAIFDLLKKYFPKEKMAGQTCSGLLSTSSNRIALDPPLLGPASILSGGLLFVRRKQVNQCSNATLGSLKARRRLLRSRAHSC